MKTKTADTLISDIRRIGGFNTNSSAASGIKDTDILAFLNEEILELATILRSKREEFFTVREKINLVDNTNRYKINDRSFVQSISDISYYNSNGDGPTHLDRTSNQQQRASYSNDATEPNLYSLEFGNIVLYPSLGSVNGYLIVNFSFKPSELVLSSNTRQITNVNTSTKTITVDSTIPSTFTTNVKYDIHASSNGAEIKQWELDCSTASGTSITFTDEIDNSVTGRFTVEVGDYVCLEEECTLLPLPTECYPYIMQSVVLRVYESQGDADAIALAQRRLDRTYQVLQEAILYRSGDSQKVFTQNGLWDLEI